MEFLSLFVVAYIGAITPGPDSLLVMHNTLRFGALQGLKVLAGIATGWIVFLAIIYFGFAHILRGNWVEIALSFIGGLYLLYIAYMLFKSTTTIQTNTQRSADSYLKALFVNLSNPKAILFFSIIITPFMQKDLILSLIVLYIGLSCAFLSIIIMSSICRYYFHGIMNVKVFAILDKICAVLFSVFAFLLFYHGYRILESRF